MALTPVPDESKCRRCSRPLFKDKFCSRCGWPAGKEVVEFKDKLFRIWKTIL